MEVPDTTFNIGDKLYGIYQEVNSSWKDCPHCTGGKDKSTKSKQKLKCSYCHGAGGFKESSNGLWVVTGDKLEVLEISLNYNGGWEEGYIFNDNSYYKKEDLFSTKEEAETEAEVRNGN